MDEYLSHGTVRHFALNLFGMFELGVPSGLVSKLDKQAQSGQTGTTLTTILMGVTFTLTS